MTVEQTMITAINPNDENFNPCAQLVESDEKINQFLESVKDQDTLSLILENQLKLQLFLEQREDWYMPSFDPNVPKTCGEILDMLRYCKQHFDREFIELEDALGGMSNGVKNASAVAKPWKKDHLQYKNRPFNELSREDKLEVEFEVSDLTHFFAMMMVAVGMTSDRAKYLYTQKNLENFDRQRRGY